MLIVNADDFGYSKTVTNPTLQAFDRQLISSATAMVWMPDSERAAPLAREHGLPLGLHLNLTLPFRGPGVPSGVQELQRELTERFSRESWQEEGHTRRRDPMIRQAVADQLRAFRELYGEPTHIDGHHHVHVNPAVLACLPREIPIRPVIRGPETIGGRLPRRDRRLRARFRTVDGCVGLRGVHPELGGTGLGVLRFAQRHILEVMVHVQYEEERQALNTPAWVEATRRLGLGSYRDAGV